MSRLKYWLKTKFKLKLALWLPWLIIGGALFLIAGVIDLIFPTNTFFWITVFLIEWIILILMWREVRRK